MGLVFWLTFDVIGAWLQNLLSAGIDALGNLTDNALAAANVNDVLRSLIRDGIFGGVGSVLSFLPVIVVLFSSFLSWKIPDIWRGLRSSWTAPCEN